MTISLAEAKKWRAQQDAPRHASTARSHYARHERLVIALHFGPDRWTASDIARLVKEKDPALKSHKLNTITAAFCRRIQAEERRRAAAQPTPD